MNAKNTLKAKQDYNEFVNFMRRYERENKRQVLKEKYKNPYKWKKVFTKEK